MSESNKIYVLNVVVSLISPVRLAGEDKIKEILGIEKIPATMRALLAQEVIDRQILNPLATIKKRVRDTLLKFGTREPLLGWVVDPERIDALRVEIDRHQQDFAAAKQSLLIDYAQSCAKHIEKLRQACIDEGMENIELFLDVIRDSQPSEEYLRGQLQFQYLQPRAVELHGSEFEIVQQGVFAQAIADVTRRAEEAQKALRPSTRVKALEEIDGKLRGLAYLDSRFGRVANEIEALIGELPVNLPNDEWDSRSTWALSGAIDLLSDRKRLMGRIEQEDSLFDLTPVVMPDLASPQPDVAESRPARTAAPAQAEPSVAPVPAVLPLEEASVAVASVTPAKPKDTVTPFVIETVAW